MGAQQQSLKNKQRKAHLAQVAQHKKSLSLSGDCDCDFVDYCE